MTDNIQTTIKTLEGVKDLLRIELNAKSLDEITHTLNGTDVHADTNPVNRVYTQIEDQLRTLKAQQLHMRTAQKEYWAKQPGNEMREKILEEGEWGAIL